MPSSACAIRARARRPRGIHRPGQPAKAHQRTGHLRSHPQRPRRPHLRRQHHRAVRPGAQLRPRHAALRPSRQRQNLRRAHALASVFNDVIYVPYAIIIEGQIIRVFDPSIHIPLDACRAGVRRTALLHPPRRTTTRAGFPAAGPLSSPAANSRWKCSTCAMTPPAISTRRRCT